MVVLDVVVIDVYGGFVCFVFWVVDYIGCLCVVCECYECCDNDVFVDEFVYSFCNLVWGEIGVKVVMVCVVLFIGLLCRLKKMVRLYCVGGECVYMVFWFVLL